jgi:hypothetical protein
MLNDLSNLIVLRNFLHSSIQDLSVEMSSEKSNAVSKKLAAFNKEILNVALTLDVEELFKDLRGEGKSVRSTTEVKDVAQLDRMYQQFGTANDPVKLGVKPKAKIKVQPNEAAK